MPYREQYSDDEVGSLFLWVVALHRLVWHWCFRTVYSSHLRESRCPRRKTHDLHFGTAYWSHLQGQYVQEESLLFIFLASTKGPIQCPRMIVANPPIQWNNPEHCRFHPILQQKPGILHYKVISLELFKPFFFTISIIHNSCNSQTGSLNYKWLPAGCNTPATGLECMYCLYLLFIYIGSFTQYIPLFWRNSRAKIWVIDTWCAAGVSLYLNQPRDTLHWLKISHHYCLTYPFQFIINSQTHCLIIYNIHKIRQRFKISQIIQLCFKHKNFNKIYFKSFKTWKCSFMCMRC